LDHGVMGLDSSLKQSASGFSRYYELKDRTLAGLTEGFVRFDFTSEIVSGQGIFKIRVSDSGSGFDLARLTSQAGSNGGYYGRGLALLRNLCAELNYLGCGNQVEAIFHWDHTDE